MMPVNTTLHCTTLTLTLVPLIMLSLKKLFFKFNIMARLLSHSPPSLGNLIYEFSFVLGVRHHADEIHVSIKTLDVNV